MKVFRFGWQSLRYVAAVPLAWVYVTKGHSGAHPFLCNRNLSVFFASAFFLASTIAKPLQSEGLPQAELDNE